MIAERAPRSCDTLVILPESSSGLPVCFGKNSDRPSDEEHQVVHIPRQEHPEGALVRCTYIEIPQSRQTLAVILSKPRWIWGCEMGSNECGVVGGNEAVGTRASDELGDERRLLGMDLLRLALERGSSAREAVEICAKLLEAHGQGGGCEEGNNGWTYENGFLFADAREAFILETAGVSWWATERVVPGTFRNISNGISIRASLHSVHAGLKSHCLAKGWWDGAEPFDFKQALTGRASRSELMLHGRERAGHHFLEALHGDIQSGAVQSSTSLAKRMMTVLRDEDSGICFRDLHGFNSTGSQVSLLPATQGVDGTPAGGTHFFTCASDPKVAAYKLFDFSQVAKGNGERLGEFSQGLQSLALWRLHRERALAGKPPQNLEEIEAAALAPYCSAQQATLLQLIETELCLLRQ